MFTKEDILKKLNSDNYYIDMNALDTFIKEWQIDAIYENMEGVEFFDETSIAKIKKGISLNVYSFGLNICVKTLVADIKIGGAH